MSPAAAPPASAPEPGPGRLPRRRRFLFVALGAVLVWAALELLAVAGLSLADGGLFSPADGDARRRAVAADPTRADAGLRPDVTSDLAPHPFVGFVLDPDAVALDPSRSLPVNDFGFLDPRPSIRRRSPDRLLVGITGGSVAAWLSHVAPAALAEAIAASPELAGREVELVHLALGGFRQPQQLMTLQYLLVLGGELDVLVNLDGFNEVAIHPVENAPAGVFYAYPRSWHRLMTTSADADRQLLVGKLALFRHLRRRWAAGWEAVPGTPLVHLLWRLGDLGMAGRARTAEQALLLAPETGLPYRATGPRAPDATLDDLVELWVRSSVELDRLSRAHGIRYLHFLQPNQHLAGAKPMGPGERRVAIADDGPYRGAAERGYPALVAAGERIRGASVRYVDLTGLFAADEEPVYSDSCCHFNQRGYDAIARAIGGAVAAALAEEGANGDL